MSTTRSSESACQVILNPTTGQIVAEQKRHTAGDLKAAVAGARKAQADCVVMINDHLMSHGMPVIPWGGYKQSSIGRCHGELGFFEVTQAKVVVDDLLHRSPRNLPAGVYTSPRTSGRPRCFLSAERRFFSCSRRSRAALLGRVSLRRLGFRAA
jgi:hypothetical protein